MQPHTRLLLNNQAWVKERLELRTNYFRRMLKGQSPSGLWIGCSDSRVPAEEITCSQPGELFVHRNIANVFHPDDNSAMSVVQYAVEVLKVKFIVICGHYGCGGALASINPCGLKIVDKWLEPVKKKIQPISMEGLSRKTLLKMADDVACMNVIEGVKRLQNTDIIQRAWKDKKLPVLLGWIYNTFEGSLSQLIEIHPVSGENTQKYTQHEIQVARS